MDGNSKKRMSGIDEVIGYMPKLAPEAEDYVWNVYRISYWKQQNLEDKMNAEFFEKRLQGTFCGTPVSLEQYRIPVIGVLQDPIRFMTDEKYGTPKAWMQSVLEEKYGDRKCTNEREFRDWLRYYSQEHKRGIFPRDFLTLIEKRRENSRRDNQTELSKQLRWADLISLAGLCLTLSDLLGL